MSEILQSRYDQLLRRVCDLKGPGSKVNDALTELFPMFDVENLPSDLLLLAGTRLAMGEINLGPGGAGTFVQCMLRNPGDSGSIITLHQIRVGSGNAQLFGVGPSLNTLGTASDTAFVDTRIFPEQPVGQVLFDVTLMVIGPTVFHLRAAANEEAVFSYPPGLAVIAPGTAFSVTTFVANTNMTCSFFWRERVAQPSELQL